jgi:hypothetical protein
MSEMSDDAKKLAESIDRLASASVGLAWQQSVGYHMASLLASHSCCSFLIYMKLAYTDEIKMMVFVSVSKALKQYYVDYKLREVPAFSPPFKFKKGAESPLTDS